MLQSIPVGTASRTRTVNLILSLLALPVAVSAWAQVCTPAPSGMVGWWPGDGNANDIVGNNNGVLLGNTSFTAAEVRQGFTFGTDADGVTVAHNANLNVQNPGFAVDLWMRGIKNQPQALYLVIDKSHGWVDSTGWAFQGDSSTGRISFFIGAGGAGSTNFPAVTSGVDVLDGNFHHLAGTWDGGTTRLYVDGALQGSVALSSPANNTRDVHMDFSWGGGSPNRFFRGTVDEVQIYNRALSASEIAAIFSAGSGGVCRASYYFSQLALGGGWQTTLTYVNYSPQTVTCVTTFFTDLGAPLPVPFGGAAVLGRTDVLPPGGTLHQETQADLNANVVQGWAQAQCDGPIKASLLYRLYQQGAPVSEASVNAMTAPATKFATFAETRTGVAYANPSLTQSALITFTVLNSAGVKLGSTSLILPPGGHGAKNLGPLLGLQNFVGLAEITASIPIVSLSLNFEAFPVFSSLPAGELSDSTALATQP